MTLLESADRIMAAEEPEASRRARPRCFGDEGIEVRTGVEVGTGRARRRFRLPVGRRGRSVATSCWSRPAARTTSPTSGWRPSASTRTATAVETDERLRAGERLWAVGDITGKGAFTHVSRYQAAVAVRDLLGVDGPRADYRAVCRVTFTDPEIGSVGLTEAAGPGRRDRGPHRPRGQVERSSRGWIHGRGTPAGQARRRRRARASWSAAPSWRRTAAR